MVWGARATQGARRYHLKRRWTFQGLPTEARSVCSSLAKPCRQQSHGVHWVRNPWVVDSQITLTSWYTDNPMCAWNAPIIEPTWDCTPVLMVWILWEASWAPQCDSSDNASGMPAIFHAIPRQDTNYSTLAGLWLASGVSAGNLEAGSVKCQLRPTNFAFSFRIPNPSRFLHPAVCLRTATPNMRTWGPLRSGRSRRELMAGCGVLAPKARRAVNGISPTALHY